MGVAHEHGVHCGKRATSNCNTRAVSAREAVGAPKQTTDTEGTVVGLLIPGNTFARHHNFSGSHAGHCGGEISRIFLGGGSCSYCG